MWICPYPGGHIQATGIDDRGFYRDGKTIGHALALVGDDGEAPAIQGPVEEAVLDLIT